MKRLARGGERGLKGPGSRGGVVEGTPESNEENGSNMGNLWRPKRGADGGGVGWGEVFLHTWLGENLECLIFHNEKYQVL